MSNLLRRFSIPLMLAHILISTPAAAAVIVDDYEDGCLSVCFPTVSTPLIRDGLAIDDDMRVVNYTFYNTAQFNDTALGSRLTSFASGDEAMWNGSARRQSLSGPAFRFLGASFAAWDVGDAWISNMVASSTIVLRGLLNGVELERAEYDLFTEHFVRAAGFSSVIDRLEIFAVAAPLPGHNYLMDDFTWEAVPEPETALVLICPLLFTLARTRRQATRASVRRKSASPSL